MITLFLLSLAAPAQGHLEHIDRLGASQDEQRFGASFTELGDINQDGISDFAVGSPGYISPTWGWGGGKVEVFSGLDRSLLYTVQPDPGIDSLLGLTLNTLGDINQDGANEMLVGAGGYAAAYIVDGQSGQRISEVITNSNGQVGMTSTTLGDLNQDGLPEFALGLPTEEHQGDFSAGKVMVFDGATGLVLRELYGVDQNLFLGQMLCAPGDLNGDGTPDLLINGSQGAAVPSDGFTAYDGITLQPLFTRSRQDLRLDVTSMEAFADYNQDGTPDFLLSGYKNNFDGSWIQGQTRIVSGTNGRLLKEINGNQFEEFGRKVTSLGDVDGDGLVDFATMELILNRAWQSRPRIRVFSGANAQEIDRFESSRSSYFVVDIHGISDLDQDGRDDIVIAVPENQIGWISLPYNPGGEVHLLGVKQ